MAVGVFDGDPLDAFDRDSGMCERVRPMVSDWSESAQFLAAKLTKLDAASRDLFLDYVAQDFSRTVGDPWEDTLQHVAELASRTADDEAQTVGGHYACDGTRERIATAYILGQVLGIPSAQQSPEHTKRLGVVMRKLGWEGPSLFRIGGPPVRGYERDLPPV